MIAIYCYQVAFTVVIMIMIILTFVFALPVRLNVAASVSVSRATPVFDLAVVSEIKLEFRV